jgi:glycosyltransferase involved in cell wall biosynthesis
VIAAFEKVRSGKKLLIVGSAPYSDKYIEELRSTKDPRVIFAGGVYKEGYHELQANAYCYVQATEVGGTHPALIEAMAAGNCVIANGTPENREALQDCGLLYRMNDVDELRCLLQRTLDDPSLARELGEKASARAAAVYSWETITDQYERLFLDLAKSRS